MCLPVFAGVFSLNIFFNYKNVIKKKNSQTKTKAELNVEN